MKIAIQGHPTRGEEVIQILESLGGKNRYGFTGTNSNVYYFIAEKNIIDRTYRASFTIPYKFYILEEFEKEFPFKVGDKVISLADHKPHKVIALEYYNDKLCYVLDTSFHYTPQVLKYYKEMKEERNIILTLEKAKEWYKKGGELREIALQAFSEKELNPLPRSWEEYCRKYGYVCLSTRYANLSLKYDALIKLEHLRNYYRGSFITDIGMPIWNISIYDGKPHIFQAMWGKNQSFLSFQSKEIAEEFLKCFKDLIKQAGDLIS